MEGGGRVQFDFPGSLQLARMLWSLADQVEDADRGRETTFDTAMAKWEGEYGTQFVGRRDIERQSGVNAVSGLRDGAREWAQAWARAMDQQNANNRAAQVEEIRSNRSFLERNVGDRIMGDDSDDQVPMPSPVRVPTAPGFAPTASVTVY